MDLKAMLKTAMLAKDELARDMIRIIMGEVSVRVARSGKEPSLDEIHGIIRKIITNNTETRKELENRNQTAHDSYVRLAKENSYLETLLPKALDKTALLKVLEPIAKEIKDAKNDGQATGIAMKQLKSQGHTVPGDEVSALVKELRAS